MVVTILLIPDDTGRVDVKPEKGFFTNLMCFGKLVPVASN
jgi:hypothetical protein